MNNQLELSKAEFPFIIMIMFVTNLLLILCVRRRMSTRTPPHKCPILSKSNTGVVTTPKTKSAETETAGTAGIKRSKSDEIKQCFEVRSPGHRSIGIDVEEDRSPKAVGSDMWWSKKKGRSLNVEITQSDVGVVQPAMTPTRSEPEKTPLIEPMKTQRDE